MAKATAYLSKLTLGNFLTNVILDVAGLVPEGRYMFRLEGRRPRGNGIIELSPLIPRYILPFADALDSTTIQQRITF